MPNLLRIAQSELANATRSGDAQRIKDARTRWNRLKLRAAILEHGEYLEPHERLLLDKALDDTEDDVL